MPRPDTRAPRDQIQAAGTICRRPAPDGGLEVLLVRSARWNEWSWPKGKLEPGEALPECAVREVAEETGVQVTLGVPLPSVNYRVPDGRAKTVRYWAAQVHGSGPRSAPDTEIADVAWLPVPAARERLSRTGDLVPLDAMLALQAAGRLDTRSLLVLRHAKARSRARWDGDEADRPLTGTGRRQAREVAGLLACWAPERLLSSPWARCRQTLQPYLDEHPAGVELLPLLSELGLHHDPDRVGALIAELLAGPGGALLCTHRPVLATVVEALAGTTELSVRPELPDGDPWLSPAEVLVAQVSDRRYGRRVINRIQSVENYRGEPVRKNVR